MRILGGVGRATLVFMRAKEIRPSFLIGDDFEGEAVEGDVAGFGEGDGYGALVGFGGVYGGDEGAGEGGPVVGEEGCGALDGDAGGHDVGLLEVGDADVGGVDDGCGVDGFVGFEALGEGLEVGDAVVVGVGVGAADLGVEEVVAGEVVVFPRVEGVCDEDGYGADDFVSYGVGGFDGDGGFAGGGAVGCDDEVLSVDGSGGEGGVGWGDDLVGEGGAGACLVGGEGDEADAGEGDEFIQKKGAGICFVEGEFVEGGIKVETWKFGCVVEEKAVGKGVLGDAGEYGEATVLIVEV